MHARSKLLQRDKHWTSRTEVRMRIPALHSREVQRPARMNTLRINLSRGLCALMTSADTARDGGVSRSHRAVSVPQYNDLTKRSTNNRTPTSVRAHAQPSRTKRMHTTGAGTAENAAHRSQSARVHLSQAQPGFQTAHKCTLAAYVVEVTEALKRASWSAGDVHCLALQS